MSQQRYDIWDLQDGFPAIKTLFWGVTKRDAIGYIAGKNWNPKTESQYYATIMGDSSRKVTFEAEYGSALDKMNSTFEVCQSWTTYPQEWTECYATDYISSAKAFIIALSERYDRQHHYCIRRRQDGVILDFLPRDFRKVSVN